MNTTTTTMRATDIVPFSDIKENEDPFDAIERMYRKNEEERAKKAADRKYKARQQKIMRERKIASGILFVFMLIATLALEIGFLMLVYNVWHPEFYDFLIIAMIGIGALICIMGLSYEYIKEKIYEDLIR